MQSEAISLYVGLLELPVVKYREEVVRIEKRIPACFDSIRLKASLFMKSFHVKCMIRVM